MNMNTDTITVQSDPSAEGTVPAEEIKNRKRTIKNRRRKIPSVQLCV